ncbi:hypothetical protein RN001_016119 [Aquatica leii]|uniref:Mutator-like transposase domain-containing protein n=1 Tax=Aquatica leii TaxID=1421715 RepID=A0AAN7SN08_9COLE|nr:hypothetical protein RN001_016119 [Aquatica leii]
MEEFFAHINTPFLPYRVYTKEHENLSDIVHDVLWSEMEKAAKEEANIAKRRGDVDENGVPLITVVADGSWAKRSYRKNYNSSSGVVHATRKVVLSFHAHMIYFQLCSRRTEYMNLSERRTVA